MLHGFEDQTEPLTEYEEGVLLPAMIKGFVTKVGADNAITNAMIVEKMKHAGYKINDARVRKIVNHIRLRHLVPGLIASSKGYYVSKDPEEVRQYITSLQGRETAINMVKVSFQRYLEQLLPA